MTTSSKTKWHPKSEAISGKECEQILSQGENVAVHFWAVWNEHDKQMDEVIQRIKPRLDGWINFYSCDIDEPENVLWCKILGIVSIPCIMVFQAEKKHNLIIGIKEDLSLTSEILMYLTDENDANSSWWKFW